MTEEVTGIDVVQTQLRIAAGESLEQIGLRQEEISARGVAIQCRITTENAERNFTPDTGTLSVYRHSVTLTLTLTRTLTRTRTRTLTLTLSRTRCTWCPRSCTAAGC